MILRSIASFVLALPLCATLATAQSDAVTIRSVERAPEWDALFRRGSGWTGADGIYSIPLSGVDAPGAGEETPTLFLFGDTFIGEVGDDGERLPGWAIVSNTLALIPAGGPDPARARFGWGRGDDRRPEAVFEPETPRAEEGDWYWHLDGVRLGGLVHILSQRMRRGDGGDFDFAVDGMSLITFDPAAPDPLMSHRQVDTPLFRPARGRFGDIAFGAGILPNTAEAGSPAPDGFIYVYGTRGDFLDRKVLVARVEPERFTNFSAWRFWDGSQWGADITAAAPVGDRASSELSASPLPDGRFVLVFQLDGLGRQVAARVGASPVGPFGDIVRLWDCPEVDLDPDVYVYNAKAHPHLSRPGELLVSYNVNSFQFGDHLRHAGLYRPRFIRVRFATNSAPRGARRRTAPWGARPRTPS